MPLRPLQRPVPGFQSLLDLKGSGLTGVWDELVPVIDIQQFIGGTAQLESDSADFAVTAIGFNGITVPDGEFWTVYLIGSMSDTLGADQTIRLQSAIRTPTGYVSALDVSGVALSGATGQSNRGGVGQFLYPFRIPSGYALGVNVSQITVGVEGDVDLSVTVLHSTERP